jgi:hypothetical protein
MRPNAVWAKTPKVFARVRFGRVRPKNNFRMLSAFAERKPTLFFLRALILAACRRVHKAKGPRTDVLYVSSILAACRREIQVVRADRQLALSTRRQAARI